MKRLLILVLLLPLLAACGGGNTASSGEGAAASGELSKELYLYNWSEYIDPAILEDFEAEFGARVIQDLYDSNESMIPKIRAGNSGYDIVVPSDYAVQIMVKEGLLAELDKSMLPNLENIDETNLGIYFDPENTYSVPYFWGVTGIAYNKKFFDTPPSSWSVLFDEASMEEFDGRFTMLNDSREAPGAALIYEGASVNVSDAADLSEAQRLLEAQKTHVAAYDSSNVNLRLATEEIVLAHAWSGMAATALVGIGDKPGNENIAFVIPDEGGVIWQDNLSIVADSPNKETAHVFINYLMRPEVAAKNADWVLYLTPNKAAREFLSQETKDVYATGIEPDDTTIERLQWIERNPDTDTAFSDLWTQVTGQ